jgi:outer membrane protein assembly factor BamE
MQRLLLFCLILLVGTQTAGCFNYYRMDIQQGNVVNDEMLGKLRPGMSRDQVRYVLGTPLVDDPFHSDRWDYVYSFKAGGSKSTEQSRLTVYFSNNRAQRFEKDGQSFDPASVAAPAAPAAEEPVVVKGDGDAEAPKKSEKGILRRTWDKIWD